MLSFASPQYAWALALPAAVLVLYLLRRRYVPQAVPSTFLWRKTQRDHAANRPLQRLRKNILLPVQLAAMLALALALMQPGIAGDKAGRTILIFDVSGSMQAESSGKTRLDLAKEQAKEILNSLPAGEEITVLSCGEETRQLTLSVQDRAEVSRAIQSIRCGKGTADLDRALSLAEAIRGRIIVFSDAYIPSPGASAVNVGQPGENRAVCMLTAEEGKVYARVANFGDSCTLSLTCLADGRLADARELQIPEGETAGVTFTIPEGTTLAEVAIRENDALPADNRAVAAVMRNEQRTVALTEDSLFLESALKVRPDLTLVRADLENPESISADLYILGKSPLIFTRHPGDTVFSFGEEKPASAPLSLCSAEKLTTGLTVKDVSLRSYRPVSGGKALLQCGGDTAAAWTDSEVILGFDLQDSNLPMKYDFPVLVQNILEMLIPRRVAAAPETEPLMPREESDVRRVEPSAEGTDSEARLPAGSRDLTIWFIAAFLFFLLLEFLLARI